MINFTNPHRAQSRFADTLAWENPWNFSGLDLCGCRLQSRTGPRSVERGGDSGPNPSGFAANDTRALVTKRDCAPHIRSRRLIGLPRSINACDSAPPLVNARLHSHASQRKIEHMELG